MVKNIGISFIALTILMFSVGCEKEITVDLPPYEAKIVVEGTIEPGIPPVIFLTRSAGFFDPTDINAYQNSFIHGAFVTMTKSGGAKDTLVEICTASLPPEILPFIEELTGISAAELSILDICLYTSIDTTFWGQVGESYALSVQADGDVATATTYIPQPIPLDSAYFEIEENTGTYGFMWATLTDPAGLGNAYRWFAKRLNKDASGNVKDFNFVAPFGSAFNDEFIENLTFDFAFSRPGSAGDESTDREGYYNVGDTVAIKFTTIPFDAYEFLFVLEQQQSSQGSPFASPANVPSNVTGGLGLWIGYGVSYDTVVCAP
jgi:hypothetical protein